MVEERVGSTSLATLAGMPSPERDAILQLLRSLPRHEPTRENIASLRSFLDAFVATPPRETRAHEVDAGGVRGEWLRIGDADPDRRILYLHGGAYIAGSNLSHRALAARIGRAAGASVLLVSYRLAPESPHPAAVDDAVAALRWMQREGPDGPQPPRHAFVVGDSAGGGLALATALAVRDAGGRLPDALVTLSAWTDLAMTGESVRSRAAVDPMIDVRHMHPAAALYLGDHAARSPLASPLYAELAGLPPIYMQVGDEEVLLDDTTRFAERASGAGVEVEVEIWPGMFHVFQAFAGALPEGREAIARIGAYLRRRAETPPEP